MLPLSDNCNRARIDPCMLRKTACPTTMNGYLDWQASFVCSAPPPPPPQALLASAQNYHDIHRPLVTYFLSRAAHRRWSVKGDFSLLHANGMTAASCQAIRFRCRSMGLRLALPCAHRIGIPPDPDSCQGRSGRLEAVCSTYVITSACLVPFSNPQVNCPALPCPAHCLLCCPPKLLIDSTLTEPN